MERAVVRGQALRLADVHVGLPAGGRLAPRHRATFFSGLPRRRGRATAAQPLDRLRRRHLLRHPLLLALHRARPHHHLVRRRVHGLRLRRALPVGLLSLPPLPGDAVAGRKDAAFVPGGGRLRDRHRLAGRDDSARAELRQRVHHRLPLLPVAELDSLPAARSERAARSDGGAGDPGLHPDLYLRGAGSLGRPRRAGAVLLQHASGLGDHRDPDRAAAHPGRGGNQPLDVPGEVRAVAPDRNAAHGAGERDRHAGAGSARAGRAGRLASDHARLDLPGRSRRLRLRAGRTGGPQARGALRCHHPPRVLRAAPPDRGHLAGGDRARGRRPPHGLDRGTGEPAADPADARANERLGGARFLQRGPAPGRAGDPRRPPAGSLLQRRDRALPGRRQQHRHHPAELPGLRAHEGARPSGGARSDGRRSGARDPESARIDQGAAQFLQPGQAADGTKEGTKESTREFLDIIIEEVNRLNKIVSQFLDYARPYRGEQRPLEVSEVLRKTLSLLPAAQLEGAIEISTNFAERMPPVRADAEQLLQVFLNLSLNAIQAITPGDVPGKLLISTGLRRATRRGAAAAFFEARFRDSGVGIPPGDLKNLFIPFFTTKDKGTGLGLPISQRIIENHGGTIEVRSQPTEGATFTVLLPIEADAYAAYAEPRAEVRLESGRQTPPPLPMPPPPRLPPPTPGSPSVPPPVPVPVAVAGANSGPAVLSAGVTASRAPSAARKE